MAWQPPSALPDLRRVGIVALDTETRDGGILSKRGSSWPWGDGHICGVSVAYRADGEMQKLYVPLRHPDSENFTPEQVAAWLRDLIINSDVRFVTQNGLYDWGWLRTEFDLRMPPSERLEEIGALATIVDENRYKYSLDALCTWRGLPGKDESLLREAAIAAGFSKKVKAQSVLWQLPAAVVGPYAEADAASTLALFESLEPVLDREGTRAAYRLEVDLLPLVAEMRRRGIRIDTAAAEQARELLLQKRDAVFAEISDKLGSNVGMVEIGRTRWLAETFDREKITYPRTEKGNPSFSKEWMPKHVHWLPQLIVKADKYNNAAVNVLETYILSHVVNGRVHAEIHPHRSDAGGTRSLRFSYSNPPLQLMPAHDEELAPLIRGVFLPEEGEFWAEPDVSQQEFRFIVHYATKRGLPKAAEAAARYCADPDTDFHGLVAEMTGIERASAKNVNFAKAFGAGVRKFAAMIGRPESEAQALYARYDRELPFVAGLSRECEQHATRLGYLTLYDGARRHWSNWAPGGHWQKGLGPCPRGEAERRVKDSGHPWYGQKLWRADTRLAMNALIQGSAARHTKLWMRACWREGIVPLLQMHDALPCSVATLEQAKLVAQLGRDAVKLQVPMQVGLKFGQNWGDAKHNWQDLHEGTAPKVTADPIMVEAATLAAESELSGTHICVHCGLDPPDGNEVLSTYNDEWLHARCQDAFIRARMMAENIVWEAVQLAAATGTPTQLPWNILDEKQTNGITAWTNGGGNGPDYPHGESETGHKVAEFIYRDLKGKPYLKVVKRKTPVGKKSFPQYHWENGRWVSGKPKGPAIPYQLPELLAAPPGASVWICEGEKDADTLTALGLIATTNPGGAGKWTPELNKWFAGFPGARVLEDNDPAGRKHVPQVAAALCGIIPDVRVLTFHELPEQGDVTDWLEAGHNLAQLLERAEQAPKFAELECSRAADEEMESLDWIWPGRFALGKIGLLVGLPDEGKGLTLSDIIARISRGLPWPCNEGQAPIGNVVLLTAEDDINDTIIPRLVAAAADLNRVHIIKMMREGGKQRMFSLISNLEALRRKVLDIGDVRMIIIDPITAYLGIGQIDSFRATDVRAVLGPLKELAADTRLSILGVMHFNKKVDITNVLLRISDSLAYGAAARHVYGVINDPDNNRKLFVKGKNNLAPRDQATLAFGFDAREVGTDKRTGAPITAPFIVWHPDPVDISATEAMQAAAESKSPSARDNAKQFLEDLLSNGPVGSKDVHEGARENGISRITLRRAKDTLKIDVKKDGPVVDGERSWVWHLPKEDE